MYFKHFPKVEYGDHILTDITARVAIAEQFKSDHNAYEYYVVKDGDTPEWIAHRVYGDPELFWVVLILNDIIDPFYDWVLTGVQLDKYVESVYGTGNADDIHHWILDDQWYESNVIGASAVTNYQHENNLNEAKRSIKILNPNAVRLLENELKRVFD